MKKTWHHRTLRIVVIWDPPYINFFFPKCDTLPIFSKTLPIFSKGKKGWILFPIIHFLFIPLIFPLQKWSVKRNYCDAMGRNLPPKTTTWSVFNNMMNKISLVVGRLNNFFHLVYGIHKFYLNLFTSEKYIQIFSFIFITKPFYIFFPPYIFFIFFFVFFFSQAFLFQLIDVSIYHSTTFYFYIQFAFSDVLLFPIL